MTVNENSFIRDTRKEYDLKYWAGCLDGYGNVGPFPVFLVRGIDLNVMTAYQRGYLMGLLFREFDEKFNTSLNLTETST